MQDSKINKIIDVYNLDERSKIIDFINFNPLNLNVNELSKIAEKVNNLRTDTAAFYTDKSILSYIQKYLPTFDKEEIFILEPSVGVGNFLPILINNYKDNHRKVNIDVIDIDHISIDILKEILNKMEIPKNVFINFFIEDYTLINDLKNYDLIIGNPPFLKINKKIKKNISPKYNSIKNLAGLFVIKALQHTDNLIMILPKYMLSNEDFRDVRNELNKYKIERIIDFGEHGFKGVKIETLCIFINKLLNKDFTAISNITRSIDIVQEQGYITDEIYPNWLIYRNDFFDDISSKLLLGQFTVFRDRQITNKILKQNGDIRVLKSRNISRDGKEIINIENYDVYISFEDARNLSVFKYLNNSTVYLTPNMTYYPRVIRKPKDTLVNGSVAILINNLNRELTNSELDFLSSLDFQKFYSIARNYSTRSLNIDKNSVFYFGILI
ncbi:Eco57I restriction-modification methylase domain-containing protein [Macrococcus epidermidis]|uniref:Eco57I restriction-modification methylase domain-containing protein n=1 Tax=Macrococcus epidermidis TaxID=1902580 RepID=UPI0020B6638E|nr:Eco57I restriction-modification methylase domain-containing protein [Macrococcus epidermidis]UTH15636.1 Eco57I restriction-modification methylase domain-containing protein [Macrococcus epidermidis]